MSAPRCTAWRASSTITCVAPRPTCSSKAELAVLDYTIYQPGTVGTEHIGAAAMAGAVNIMRELCGARWNPNEVMLAHRRPANVEPYRQIFRAPILFDAERNAITFPAALLGQRVAASEPELHRMLTERMQAFEAQFHDEFPERVRRVLRTALLTDRDEQRRHRDTVLDVSPAR